MHGNPLQTYTVMTAPRLCTRAFPRRTPIPGLPSPQGLSTAFRSSYRLAPLSRLLSSAHFPPSVIPIGISIWNSLWDSLLRAVPKKKTSHSKKRSRFLAGKALKDVINLNRCSACGNVKRSHLLCPYCVKGMLQGKR